MAEYLSREAVFQVVHGIARGIADRDIEALKAKDMKTLYKIRGAKEILDSVNTDLCYIPVADVQPVNQWISVDDKLPATRKTVLIYDEYEGVSAGYYDSDYAKFRSIDDVYRPCNVTHWQPLPEPPKED
jgi:hypothetical protein